jgi:hypothetical protein
MAISIYYLTIYYFLRSVGAQASKLGVLFICDLLLAEVRLCQVPDCVGISVGEYVLAVAERFYEQAFHVIQ